MIADYLRCDSNGCIPVAGLRCIRVSPRAAHLRILGGMRGFGLVSWGREFRKTGSLPDPSPREQHDGTAYPGRRFALPWAISFCPFGADGWGSRAGIGLPSAYARRQRSAALRAKEGPQGSKVADARRSRRQPHQSTNSASRIPQQSNSRRSTS
jgi:hypothetical protein